MELITKSLPKNHDLFLVSDIHEGTVLKDHEGVLKMVDMVLSRKNNFVVLGGDLIEAITVDDKRYGVETSTTATPLRQCANVIRDLSPIKKKVVFALDGNHEWKLSRFGNLIKDVICAKLDIKYGTYTCKLTVNDYKGNMMYKLFYTHGSGTINSSAYDPLRCSANMKVQLKSKLYNKAGDCHIMAMAHAHKLVVVRPTTTLYLVDRGSKIETRYMTLDNNKNEYINPEHRWYACTGSFLKPYKKGVSGYTERAGYDPVELGFVVIKVRDSTIIDVQKVVI